jgi:hypothetical protein
MLFSNRTNRHVDDAYEDLRSLFYTVLDAVQDINSLPLTSASHPNGEGNMVRQRLYNASAVEFLTDVEKATKVALSICGSLDAELWNAFCAMFAGEAVAPALSRKVVTRVGRIYSARKLHPNQYFKLYRRGGVQTGSHSSRCSDWP